MIDHDRALELAATAPDFPLSEIDSDELRSHLDGCSACRATAAGFGADARAIAYMPSLDAPHHLRARVLDAAATSGEPARTRFVNHGYRATAPADRARCR